MKTHLHSKAKTGRRLVRGRASRASLPVFVLLWSTLFAPLAFAAGFPGLDKINEIGRKADEVAGQAEKGARVIKGATGLSLEEELAIGDTVALEILQRYGGLWRDAAATRRVNVIGRALARYAERQDLIWRFGLLNSDALNAFSAPGGRVFITRGLYQSLKSDDELAGAIGHEIEHIDRRHALKIIARGELFGGVSDLVSDRSKDYAQLEQVVTNITDGLLTKGFDPGTEFDADRHGRRLARTTGFAPGGLRAVIEMLRGRAAADKKTEIFSTHPPPAERLKKLPKDPPLT
jgi:predicted Zn-dependent protease